MEFIKFEPPKLNLFFGKEYQESNTSYAQRMDERLSR